MAGSTDVAVVMERQNKKWRYKVFVCTVHKEGYLKI